MSRKDLFLAEEASYRPGIGLILIVSSVGTESESEPRWPGVRAARCRVGAEEEVSLCDNPHALTAPRDIGKATDRRGRTGHEIFGAHGLGPAGRPTPRS